MVEIRKLQPLVKIQMPQRPTPFLERDARTHPNRVFVTRRRADFLPPTPQPTPCVLWQGSVDRSGYGRFKRYVGDRRETVRVIRWVMEQATGRKLRPDEFVMHACDNPPCFRVSHLSIGSAADNNRDMREKGRGSKPPIHHFRGECHPMAKLTAQQVRKIRGHRISGLSIKSIAAMFDVSPQTISKIVNGVTWASGESQQPPWDRSAGLPSEGPLPSDGRHAERNTDVKP